MARTFKDMNDIQRANVLAWALSHDWGSKAAHWHEVRPDSELVVYCAERSFEPMNAITENRPVTFTDGRYTFTNMRALRAWAGY